jgi:hypothetical protein
MGNIGIPEILLALILIGAPAWAMRGFPLPKRSVVRYALICGLTALVAILDYNWATPVRVMH